MAKRKRTLLKMKERRSRESIANFLCELAGSLETGDVVLQRGEEEVSMSVADQVRLKIKAKEKEKKGGRTKCTLKLSLKWTDADMPDMHVTVG